MKKGIFGGIVLGIAVALTLICLIICTERIPVGYEGVIYSMNGGATGETIGQGWHVISPTKKVKLFTVGNEQLVLTKDKREGSKSNDSFRVSTSDDATIAISFQMSYRTFSIIFCSISSASSTLSWSSALTASRPCASLLSP